MKFVAATALSFAVLLCGDASAQSKPSAKPKPAAKPEPAKSAKSAAKPAEPAVSAELATLQCTAKELPKGLTLGAEVKCISVQAQNYWSNPGFAEPIAPAPVAKLGQSVLKGKQVLGSVMAFEFAEPVSKDLRGFLTGLMWGEDQPTAQHPERILVTGRFVLMLSFPLGDATADAIEKTLKARLDPLGPRDFSSLAPLMKQVVAAYDARDAAAGLKLLQEHAEEVKDYAFAQYFLGEFAAAAKDHALAEKGYARALEIHDSGSDKLPTAGVVWASTDGLALALMFQQKHEQALPVLERSLTLSWPMNDDKQTGRVLYNLACAQSVLGHFEDSLDTLTKCLKLTPDRKAAALKDPDFAKAREREDFKALLGG